MIDLFGRGSFLRSWLPLALLAVLIIALFPPCGAPRRDAREAWEGLVLLVALDPPPAEPMRLLASLPLRSPQGSPEQRLVVADALLGVAESDRAAQLPGAHPILLAIPPGSRGDRLARRVPRGDLRTTVVRLELYRAEDVPGRAPGSIGAVLRRGEIDDGATRRPLPAPLVVRTVSVDFDPVRHLPWPGDPAAFAGDWRLVAESSPGDLTPFIHARITMPGTADSAVDGTPGE